MLEISDLSYHSSKRQVLDRLNWKVAEGRHSLLLGKSGCGKTTLLHLLAGLLVPSGGRILYGGKPLPRDDRWRGRNIGMVFQTFHLIDALNVFDNLRLAQHMAGAKRDEQHLRDLLHGLGMEHKASSFPYELSVGQSQRIAIARALVNRPRWVLADEPTSALDDENAASTLSLLLKQANAYGATLVVATHDSRVKSSISHQLELASLATEDDE